jgi:hypothetical protein
MEWTQKRAEIEQQSNEAIGRSTGELMAKYELLRVQWINLSNDQQKIDWIKNNQSAFNGLNLAVNDVTSAENVFVNNTSNVVTALKARAEAEAYAELYKEQIKKNAMNKASGKYNVPLITDPYYKPTEMEAKLAGFTLANKHENFEYKMVDNADPRNPGQHKVWTGRLSQIGLNRLNENRQKLGSASLENADRMLADQYASKMAELQFKANELQNNSLFGRGGSGSGNRGGGGGRSGGGGGSLPSIGDFDKALGKSLLDTDKLKEGKEMLSPYQMMLPEIEKSILKIKDADLGGALAELGNQAVADEIAAITTRMEQQQKATEMAAQAAQNFGAALAGLDDPAMKAAGTVMQAIANIALSFSMAATQASTLGPYGWIAYMAAGAGALATTISTIHSLTGYAEGGMVKGNTYSGDQIPIMANAGEVVLNKSQQATLAQNLQGNGGNLRVTGVLQGRTLLMVVENELKSQGKGEIATWKS